MEDIKDKLSEYKYNFLTNLQNYLDTELIFFGSIKRYDFFSNNSDIDIAIISDNVDSTRRKLQGFLNIPDNKMRKIVQKLPNTNTIVYGYKTNYNDINNNISLEIVLYDEKYRNVIMDTVHTTNNFPFYITFSLLILKFLGYYLQIIPNSTVKYFKEILIETYLNQKLHSNLINLKF
jgi:predicted nucleotidyltransferase